jgi:hypothetical protein
MGLTTSRSFLHAFSLGSSSGFVRSSSSLFPTPRSRLLCRSSSSSTSFTHLLSFRPTYLYVPFADFYQLEPSLNGIQSLSLSLLVLAQVCPPLALDIAANYLSKFDLFLARERSGIYSWTALVTSLLIVELPAVIVAFTLEFFCYYWTVGFGGSAGSGAFAWLQWISLAYFLVTFGVVRSLLPSFPPLHPFAVSSRLPFSVSDRSDLFPLPAQLLGAVSPTPGSIPYILSTLWIIYNIVRLPTAFVDAT